MRTCLHSCHYSEWHPFTISSAPEVSSQFTLHIRGVGQWTNRSVAVQCCSALCASTPQSTPETVCFFRLYKLFEREYERQKSGAGREVSAFDRIQGTVRKKYQSVRNVVRETVAGAIDDKVSPSPVFH